MSQQGDRHRGNSGQGDDWWGQLYDEATEDTGPAPAPDTLDDRFASATDTLGGGKGRVTSRPSDGTDAARPGPAPGAAGALAPRPPAADAVPYAPLRAPWEPPADPAAGPAPAPVPTTFGPARRNTEPSTDPSADPKLEAGLHPEPDLDLDPDPDLEPGAAAPPAVGVPAARTAPDAAVRPGVAYVGEGPPTYEADPTALPPADPDALAGLVADTVLDGARYGACTLRAASVRGDSARYRGEPRRDALLTARFGSGDGGLVLVALATGARTAPAAHLAAADACHWIGRAVGRSHARLADDIRAGRRGDLKSGLHRLTARSLGKLRAVAAEQGLEPEEYSATTLRCLLVPADPRCRTRVYFGVGPGGLFRLRDGAWKDIEPQVTEVVGEAVVGFGSLRASSEESVEGDRLTMDLGIATPPSPYERAARPAPEPFRFRASVARPGDRLLLCSGGLAEPLRGEPALAGHLLHHWSAPEPPGLTEFLADVQVRVKGYADDRTACGLWEA
ncbi:protein phosphatase 2C domain-containing protein [Streptomyces sp. LHD-70]|uniref:protein phosphatase 2C domain-containing protein n=1 Tax=Streptomyces sp. LHD-70 TaxID=3072140 RepID=UPI00280FD809|nr:protein phosphatase 2C domain-containing protein [Streptomyces sp. LHD-70]MDQ8703760.1 protein phosphatase 2C domain-containing protein [Streptomyces sp. LHD-70]